MFNDASLILLMEKRLSGNIFIVFKFIIVFVNEINNSCNTLFVFTLVSHDFDNFYWQNVGLNADQIQNPVFCDLVIL